MIKYGEIPPESGISLVNYAKLCTNLTIKKAITFDLGKFRLWCNTFFCSVWRALSRGVNLFWFWRPPKNHQFSALQFLPENPKNRKIRKNCGVTALVTFKFRISTLELSKKHIKSFVDINLKKSETFWGGWPWTNGSCIVIENLPQNLHLQWPSQLQHDIVTIAAY